MTEQTPEIPEKPVQQEVVSEIPVHLPKKSNLPKIVLLLILGLVVVAGAVYAGVKIGRKQNPPEVVPQVIEASPTPSETANWKTYTNTRYRFTLKYPSELQIKSQNKAGESVVSDEHLEFLEMSRPDLGTPISIIVEKKSYKDVLAESDKVFGVNFGNSVDRIGVTVGGVKGMRVKGTDMNSGGITVAVYLPQNDIVVVVKVVQDSHNQNLINIFDQILSTFKFTASQNLVDETANWKTYKNEKYEFELKYPSDWLFEEKFSYADGFLISQNNSRLRILPRGEFDRGLPSVEPILTEELLDKRHTKVSKWVDNEETLILYHFTGIVPTNWVKCGDDLKNCNRLEISAKIKTDLDLLQTILSTFKFLD